MHEHHGWECRYQNDIFEHILLLLLGGVKTHADFVERGADLRISFDKGGERCINDPWISFQSGIHRSFRLRPPHAASTGVAERPLSHVSPRAR